MAELNFCWNNPRHWLPLRSGSVWLTPSKGELFIMPLLVVAVGLLLAWPSESATIRVPTDFPSLQPAIDSASIEGGDVVLIEDSGIYSGGIRISRPIRLIAAPGQTPTIRSDGAPVDGGVLSHSNAAVGGVIGSNEGGRITIDGAGHAVNSRLIASLHTGGEVKFENLRLTGGHGGLFSFIYPDVQVASVASFNNVEVDCQGVVDFPIRPDQLRGGVLNLHRVTVDDADRMAILHSTANGAGTVNIDHCVLVGKQLAIAIETGTGAINWNIFNSYLGNDTTGSFAAIWVRSPGQQMYLNRSVLRNTGTGSAFFLFPGSNGVFCLEHCDVISENIGVRLDPGGNRTLVVRNSNIITSSGGFLGTPGGTDSTEIHHNNVTGGYGSISPGVEDVDPPISPAYPSVSLPSPDYRYGDSLLLTADTMGGPIGSRYALGLPVEATPTPKPVDIATPTPTSNLAATPTPSHTPNASELNYIQQFIAYWQARGQVPDDVPRLADYATPANYDRLHMGGTVTSYVNSINSDQNLIAGMGWGSSYGTHSLNDMFAATGDMKYLRGCRDIVIASLANTDEKVGHQTFFGEFAPAWGTPYYAGRHVVHAVHTGMIAFGIVEFLEHVSAHPEILDEVGANWNQMATEIAETLDWHNRQWIDGPAADEGYYISKDNEPEAEGNPLAVNRMSAMGLALWGSWKATGNEEHRDKARRMARYMKRRMAIYAGPKYGEGACFWGTFLVNTPVSNPRPESEASFLNGGEDLSHAALTIAFPLQMALAGEVFTESDLDAFANTVTRGFGRLGAGILYGDIVGKGVFDPSYVLIPGYFFPLAEHSSSAYEVIAQFMLRYQKHPRNVDISQLIRYLPRSLTETPSGWTLR